MIELIEGPGPAWDRCESALSNRGESPPLYHRAAWAAGVTRGDAQCSLLVVRDPVGGFRGAFAFESAATRSLPGHRILSIQRLGVGAGGLDEAALDEALGELCRRARVWPVLRVTVDVFALDSDMRSRTSSSLRKAGFHRVPSTRSYEKTLVVDLTPSEDSLFAGIHKNARQGVRNISRYPVRLTTATSASMASRLQELSDETRARTGGEPRELDWESIIRLSAEHPALSRIATLERTDRSGPEAVIAFAWGCMHGNVGEYAESGSTRPTDLKVSTSYSLLWDLITWARKSGARWFDLGGITEGATHSADPLGGISDFKRRFSQLEVEVGEQWEWEPRPVRARIARIVSTSAGRLRSRANRLRA